MLPAISKLFTGANKKRVYTLKDGTASDRALLGCKGANLCEMTRLVYALCAIVCGLFYLRLVKFGL